MSISRKLKNAASDSSSGGGGSAGGHADDLFSTYLYEGTGQDQNIVNGVDLAGEGGLVWIKSRTTAGGGNIEGHHALYDTERGTGQGLRSDTTEPAGGHQYDDASLVGYNPDGFDISYSFAVNSFGTKYTSWTFRKAPNFFDVVTYTGDGVAGREIPHNLGCVPGMVIAKRTDSTGDWYVQHRGIASNKVIFLNDTMASYENNAFNDSYPTSTSFSVNSSLNNDGAEYVAYLFAHDDSDESMIKCGSFIGADKEVDLGWEPQFILYKEATTTGPWRLMDPMRGMPNNAGTVATTPTTLKANDSSAESVYDQIWPTSTGFYLNNGSLSAEYIYVAIRRPNKPAEEFEPEELFTVGDYVGTGEESLSLAPSEFPVDLAMHFQNYKAGAVYQYTSTRLTAGKSLTTNSNAAEASEVQVWDNMGGVSLNNQGNSHPRLQHMWRRASGFFDVVTYTPYGSPVMDVPHNLGVEPEMIWIKNRDSVTSWRVYNKSIGNEYVLELNDAAGSSGPSADHWDNTTPTESLFTVGDNPVTNYNNQSCIAYLFATVPGISKVGSYTGTGADLDIDCGFTAGARFVLIKRTDSTGDWMQFDTERGITVSDSPLLKLNETDAQASGSYIKPHIKGFTATSNLTSISGAEYIFYAIA